MQRCGTGAWLSDDIRESEYQLLSQEVMLWRRRLTAVDTVILVQLESPANKCQ